MGLKAIICCFFIATGLRLVKKKEMKSTPLVVATLEILKQEAKPLSVPILLENLAERDIKPNKTTLYRMLEKLVESKQVESVLLSNKAAHYELTGHHHHHFVCRSCDTVTCIEDEALENKIHDFEKELQKQGLKVDAHQFSISGACQSCQ